VIPAERENHRAQLGLLLDGCLAGHGGAVAIRGPIASGKTEILGELTEQAASAGAAVLSAFAKCSESDVALGVIGQIFRHPEFTSAEQERLGRVLFRDGIARSCEADGLPLGGLPTWVNQEIWELLREKTQETALVITVDDVHFADRASLQALIEFAARARHSRLLIAVAEVDFFAETRSGQSPTTTRILRQPHFTRIQVRPLTRHATAELLADTLGRASGTDLATDSWHWLSGGSPLLLRALIEDYRGATWLGADRPVEPVAGAEYSQAAESCVRRGGSWFQDVARAIAVLEESGSAELLPRLLDEHRTWLVGDVVDALELVGVLHGGRYRHPAARAAVLASTPAGQRTKLHQAAASLLHDCGKDANAIAVHLVAARHSQERWAFTVLMQAADDALRRDDTAFTEACLVLAAEARLDEDQLVAVTMLRSLAEFRRDPGAAFSQLRPVITAMRDGRLSASDTVTLLRRLLWHGTEHEIATALQCLDRTEHTLNPKLAGEYHTAREWVRSAHPPLAEAAGQQALPARETPAGPRLWAAAALSRLLRTGPAPDDIHTAELVLQTTPLDDHSYGGIQAALYILIYGGRYELAQPWCDALLREADQRQVPVWLAMFATTRAEIALRRGEPRLAARLACQALNWVSPRGWGVSVGSPLACLLLADTAIGEESPDSVPAAELPELMFQTRFGVQFLHARGQRRLALDWSHGALDDLMRCGRLMQEWEIDLPSFVPWRADAAQALLRLGRPDQARRLAAAQLTLPGADQPRVRGLSLRSLAAVSEPGRQQAMLQEAIGLLEESGDQLELARALTDLSELHRWQGSPGQARLTARRALAIAEPLGLAPLVRRLSTFAERPEPELTAGDQSDRLSASERQVVTLAAAGHSNREIAQKLYITVSTVEQHLTRAYRKLGVRGRADLRLVLQPD
jgi:DNA-binding CsgD family transcriptional regulator